MAASRPPQRERRDGGAVGRKIKNRRPSLRKGVALGKRVAGSAGGGDRVDLLKYLNSSYHHEYQLESSQLQEIRAPPTPTMNRLGLGFHMKTPVSKGSGAIISEELWVRATTPLKAQPKPTPSTPVATIRGTSKAAVLLSNRTPGRRQVSRGSGSLFPPLSPSSPGGAPFRPSSTITPTTKSQRLKKRRERLMSEHARLLAENSATPSSLGVDLSTVAISKEKVEKKTSRLGKNFSDWDRAASSHLMEKAAGDTSVWGTMYDIPVSPAELQTLDGYSWLSDEIVNFSINMALDVNSPLSTTPTARQIYEDSGLIYVPAIGGKYDEDAYSPRSGAVDDSEDLPPLDSQVGNMLPACKPTDVILLSTFFYTTITEGKTFRYEKVKKWTRKRNPFSEGVKLVVIPVHLGAHWTLAVVNLPARRVEYYDSLGGKGRSIVSTIFQWLRAEYKHKVLAPALAEQGVEDGNKLARGEGKSSLMRNQAPLASLGGTWSGLDLGTWYTHTPGSRCPQQRNGSDCGVFTVAAADSVIRIPRGDGLSQYYEAKEPSALDVWRREGGVPTSTKSRQPTPLATSTSHSLIRDYFHYSQDKMPHFRSAIQIATIRRVAVPVVAEDEVDTAPESDASSSELEMVFL